MTATAGRHRPPSERPSSRRPDSEPSASPEPDGDSGSWLTDGDGWFEIAMIGVFVFFVLVGVMGSIIYLGVE